MSLTIAKNRLMKSLDIARETELELYERLRDMAYDFVLLKEEVANAGFKIKPWVKENLPRSYPGWRAMYGCTATGTSS
jgi:hypothetical protein